MNNNHFFYKCKQKHIFWCKLNGVQKVRLELTTAKEIYN